ncbi:MAG: matrixin family metalloprotease [Phycisphaerales bacterium]
MNRNIALFATCTTMSMLAGAAMGATVNSNFPAGIASSDELDMQDIARGLIHSLHPDQQRAIAEHGGIGADAVDLSGFTRNFEERDLSHVPHGVTATQYLDMLLSDDMRKELSEGELNIVTDIAGLLDQGKEMPYMCFAPDVNPKFAFIIDQMLDYQFVSDDSSRFQQGNRWSRTAIDGNGLGQGDPTNITYSFAPDGSFIPNSGLGSGNSTLFQWLDGRYGNTATWQALFHQVFDRWEELTGITYTWEQNDDGRNMSSSAGVVGVRGDVRIFAFNYPADGNGGVLAYNFFPNDGDMALDAFDTFYNSTTNNSRRLRNVVAHEHGHGLGMAHVCPANSTKLMEPFVSTSYDGPQLDDILNGQRFYGDPNEPNQTLATATDLGTFGNSGIANILEASIDDNSDTDFYKITLTDRAKITMSVAPNAGQYQQGPQTSSCNSGTNTNYNTMHDLTIDLFKSTDLITPVASADATGLGGTETVVFDSEVSSGVYYAIVGTASNTNNIQRYLGSLFITALPPVVCPADLNGDGNLDFFDVSAFLAAFSAQQPDGDFNNDGLYNFFDVSDFLGAFSAGCP